MSSEKDDDSDYDVKVVVQYTIKDYLLRYNEYNWQVQFVFLYFYLYELLLEIIPQNLFTNIPNVEIISKTVENLILQLLMFENV